MHPPFTNYFCLLFTHHKLHPLCHVPGSHVLKLAVACNWCYPASLIHPFALPSVRSGEREEEEKEQEHQKKSRAAASCIPKDAPDCHLMEQLWCSCFNVTHMTSLSLCMVMNSDFFWYPSEGKMLFQLWWWWPSVFCSMLHTVTWYLVSSHLSCKIGCEYRMREKEKKREVEGGE